MTAHCRNFVLIIAATLVSGCSKGERADSDSAMRSGQAIVVDQTDTSTSAVTDTDSLSIMDTLSRYLAPGPSLEPLAGAIPMSADLHPQSAPRKSGYTRIVAGGPGCNAPTKEVMTSYEKYGAQHFCFSYALDASSGWAASLTRAVYDAIGLVLPGLGMIELYQPNQNVLRFQVKNQASYRLYTYWAHDIANLPPPGKYTDHKFINPMDRSVDYYFKVRTHAGHTVRIRGVAEVIFVPQELCELARRDRFFAGVGKARPCPVPAVSAIP